MAIYICAKCLFCFERSGEVESCPDCGCMSIRYADDKETAEYRRIRTELDSDKGEKEN